MHTPTISLIRRPLQLCRARCGSQLSMTVSANQSIRCRGSVNFNNLSKVPLQKGIHPAVGTISMCNLNVQSLRNKSASFVDFVYDSKADLVAVTETWLTDNDTANAALATPVGYKLENHR